MSSISPSASAPGWIRFRSGEQTTRNFARRDYGNRVGNWRLFEILDVLKLPATARGDDVLGHGRANGRTAAADGGARRGVRHPGMHRSHRKTR
jgi:hypothetical protein